MFMFCDPLVLEKIANYKIGKPKNLIYLAKMSNCYVTNHSLGLSKLTHEISFPHCHFIIRTIQSLQFLCSLQIKLKPLGDDIMSTKYRHTHTHIHTEGM